MSHPKDRHERFLIGKKLGEKRGYRYWNGFKFIRDEEQRKEDLRIASFKRRDTTKLCSCMMCGNPRRMSSKKDVKLTMQERKLPDWKKEAE
jgi:hypothetical protein